MHLSQLKHYLTNQQTLTIELPDGRRVPSHFHVTKVGKTTKRFIDCGGTVHDQEVATLQLWRTIDFHHRLKAATLSGIIDLAERKFELGDLPIEVEYQGKKTLEIYGLEAVGNTLRLTSKSTTCHALDSCGLSAFFGSGCC